MRDEEQLGEDVWAPEANGSVFQLVAVVGADTGVHVGFLGVALRMLPGGKPIETCSSHKLLLRWRGTCVPCGREG